MSDATMAPVLERPRKPGVFTKNDPRINKLGRPKVFDYVRSIAQQIADEIDPKTRRTIVEGILRKLTVDDGAKFIEIAYGKTTENLNINASINGSMTLSALRKSLAKQGE